MEDKKKLFISNVHEDKGYRDQVADWTRKGQLGDYEPVFETEDRRQDGSRGIKGHLSPKISECDAVVALVGDDSHNHEWVDWEVAHAKGQGKPVIPVRIPNTSGGGPREIRNEDLVRHRPAAIRDALQKKG